MFLFPLICHSAIKCFLIFRLVLDACKLGYNLLDARIFFLVFVFCHFEALQGTLVVTPDHLNDAVDEAVKFSMIVIKTGTLKALQPVVWKLLLYFDLYSFGDSCKKASFTCTDYLHLIIRVVISFQMIKMTAMIISDILVTTSLC